MSRSRMSVTLVSISMLIVVALAYYDPDPVEIVVPEGVITYQSARLMFRAKKNDTFVRCSSKFYEFDSILVIGKADNNMTLYLVPRNERAYNCIGKIYCTLFYYIPSDERTFVPVTRVLYAEKYADLPNWTSHIF